VLPGKSYRPQTALCARLLPRANPFWHAAVRGIPIAVRAGARSSVGREPIRVDCPSERRRKPRFSLALPMSYVVWCGRAPLQTGSSTTCDASTDALSFQTPLEMPVGAQVSIIVDWPVRKDGLYPVELYARGRISRSSGGRTAVKMSFRELRVITVGAVRVVSRSGLA
jgi:hypothetical protein